MRVENYMTPLEWICSSNYDLISIVAPNILPIEFSLLKTLGIDYRCYDRDPKFKDVSDYTVCDPIFDDIELCGLILNFNTEKMYPIGKVYRGEFIICGSDEYHPGNCNFIKSCEQLIEQNELHTVYRKSHIPTNRCNYYFVWGRND